MDEHAMFPTYCMSNQRAENAGFTMGSDHITAKIPSIQTLWIGECSRGYVGDIISTNISIGKPPVGGAGTTKG